MAKIVEDLNSKKLRGGYYTPREIADFMCKWAITDPLQRVLEPSCGDGNFIEASIQRFNQLSVTGDNQYGKITGVELIDSEAEKAKQRAIKYGLDSSTIINSDFFEYASSFPQEKFDVIIGNPPFIRYQDFPEKHRDIALRMMRELDLNPNKLTNIWAPFLVISASKLNQTGKLAMVIPAELFQVKYAAETRVFLSKCFQRITIVAFNRLVFEKIQQEVVLILCEKEVETNQGIRMIEVDNLADLENVDFKAINNSEIKHIDHSTEKWTKYFLNDEEIQLLRRIKADNRIKICSDIMDVDVGIVTGKNEFFMLTKDDAVSRNLLPYVTHVVGRSNHIKGIIYNNDDFHINSDINLPVYLFVPDGIECDLQPKACQDYIYYGEKMKYHTGYKCRIRKLWYLTPSLWRPDAFALRQVHNYPKLILNQAEASSTDTIHRVRFKSPTINKETVAISFLNSLTFAFSEVTGRSYGGGVLTFEPTEIEELPIPLLETCNIDINHIDMLIRNKRIEEVLDIIDRELLIKQFKFTEDEVRALRSIWSKLSKRRQNRKKRKTM